MARIHVKDTVAHPREVVFSTFRDHLEELVPYLPDIRDIKVEERDQVDEDTVKAVNLWKAKDEDIPRLASKFIKPEMLQWTDYATWRADSWTCDWDMKVGFLQDAIDCKGTNRYVARDDGTTEIIIEGDLTVDASKIPGVPRLVAGKVGSAVEGFVVKMITPNLKDVNRGLEKYLAEKK